MLFRKIVAFFIVWINITKHINTLDKLQRFYVEVGGVYTYLRVLKGYFGFWPYSSLPDPFFLKLLSVSFHCYLSVFYFHIEITSCVCVRPH
jgi:hypothetical protein